jgi:adenylate cyclase
MFDDLSVDRMVRVLDQLVTAFDHVVRNYGLEKLKTIGDAYMCAGGLTREGASHPVDAVLAAFDMVEVVRKAAQTEALPLAVRVGMHTGPVAAGVVGIDKFAFDVWGDTVNYAARLETGGAPGRINIAQSTYLRVKDFFSCSPRGKILTKEGERDMYFVDGVHPELVGAGAPPPEFARRYRIYFEREPLSFPGVLAGKPPQASAIPPAAAR